MSAQYPGKTPQNKGYSQILFPDSQMSVRKIELPRPIMFIENWVLRTIQAPCLNTGKRKKKKEKIAILQSFKI